MSVSVCDLKPTGNLAPLNMENIRYIIVHHAKAVKCSWQDINKWHKEDKRWLCAGYNEFIAKDGNVYIMRGDSIGAHCYRYNDISYGICCEGNYEIETDMPTAQYKSLVERLKFNKSRLPAFERIGCHKEFVATECPGKHFPLKQVIDAAMYTPPVHWAKAANDELLACGILKNDHTATLDNPASEGFVIQLIINLRKLKG